MSLILSGSNGLSDVDGSAATPAIRGTDANTGMFFPAADTIAFATAGTEDFRIGSAGELGVQGANYGTSGQVLTSGGSGAAPSWATPSGGVTSLAAGNGITVSASTGAVTVSQDFYTGTVNTNTSYPIGSYVFVGGWNTCCYGQGLNGSNIIYNNTGALKLNTPGTALTGTWRGRGATNGYNGVYPSGIWQRVA